MDTVRSEVSEDALASSRRGGSAASLSFSLSSSRVSAREDLVSGFEQKFAARRAHKQRRKERERQRADNQQFVSAEDARRAARDAEREIRRREMANWLPTPAALARVERIRKHHAAQQMRAVRDWYPLQTRGDDEVQAVFGGQEPRCRAGTRERAAAADQRRRDVLQTQLENRLVALDDKLAYVENAAAAWPVREHPQPAKMRARARVKTLESHRLEPLQTNARSVSALPSASRLGSKWDEKALLRHSRSLSTPFFDADDLADAAETEAFLATHRRAARQVRAAVTIQASWRMWVRRRVFLRWSRRRWAARSFYLQVWALSHRLDVQARRSLVRAIFARWKREVARAARLLELELRLFLAAEAQQSGSLPSYVVNLAITGDGDFGDDECAPSKEDSNAPAPAPAPKAQRLASMARIAPTVLMGGLINSAFAGVAQALDDDKENHARRRRAQHAEARAAVCRKVAQRAFLIWKRVLAERKRGGLNAQLCLKRAARLVFAPSVWSREKLLAVFDLWARWAAFTRATRLGLPLPRFEHPNAHWDMVVHNFQERQVRRVKAEARAPGAHLQRVLRRIAAFARRRRAKREAGVRAVTFARQSLMGRACREWRAVIAPIAADKKCCRQALAALRRYAAVKAKLRPLKRMVAREHEQGGRRRAWRAWRGVLLRTECKREWNVARLSLRIGWRRTALRVLLVWRRPTSEAQVDDNDPETRLWRTWRMFEAWRHATNKRALFRTLRFHCARLRARHMLFATLNAWKRQVWKLGDDTDRDDILEDHLAVDAWDAYRELAPLLPSLFYGHFADAAAIFAGVKTPDEDSTDAPTLYTAADVRLFHRGITSDSIADVRNTVLRGRHLVNAIDSASGNSALHVALQVEDGARRVELLTLLLTEGASTVDRPNKHGLTPRQLAADGAASTELVELLDHGIYAHYARRATAMGSNYTNNGDSNTSRLVWGVSTIMAGEYQRGARFAAEVRHQMWHSQLREELWLRQDRLRFQASSRFLPAILRGRAFLNGMRNVLCPPLSCVLAQDLSRCQTDRPRLSMPTCGVLQLPPPTPLPQPKDSRDFSELEPYMRFLQAPLLEYEPAERALANTFAAVLFSLDVPLEEVVDEAVHLQDQCAAIEDELLATMEQLAAAERQLLVLLGDCAIDGLAVAVPLLRYFKDKSDMGYKFRKELVLLRQSTARQDLNGGQSDWELPSDVEIKRLESAIACAQRKMRKLDKKHKALTDQMQVGELGFRESLVADERSVHDTCAARIRYESNRLQMAALLVKKADLERTLSCFESALSPLECGSSVTEQAPATEATADFDCREFKDDEVRANMNVAATEQITVEETCQRFEDNQDRFTRIFDAVSAMSSPNSGSDDAAAATTPGSTASTAMSTLASLPTLHHCAVALVRELFIVNLFRCCCCWLADNMAIADAEAEQSVDGDSAEPVGVVEEAPIDPTVVIPVTQLDPILAEQMIRRRRSSLTNARRVLETYQRGGSTFDVLDRESNRMKETYTESMGLLFKAERVAMVEATSERQRAQERAVAVPVELNPLTGLPELPPVHTIESTDGQFAASVNDKRMQKVEQRRNRKREEMQQAMMQHQLNRMANKIRRGSSNGRVADEMKADESDSDPEQDTSMRGLPGVYGDTLSIGNFVVSSSLEASYDGNRSFQAAGDAGSSSTMDPATIEAMWKRGARVIESRNSSKMDSMGLEDEVVHPSIQADQVSVTNNRHAPATASDQLEGSEPDLVRPTEEDTSSLQQVVMHGQSVVHVDAAVDLELPPGGEDVSDGEDTLPEQLTGLGSEPSEPSAAPNGEHDPSSVEDVEACSDAQECQHSTDLDTDSTSAADASESCHIPCEQAPARDDDPVPPSAATSPRCQAISNDSLEPNHGATFKDIPCAGAGDAVADDFAALDKFLLEARSAVIHDSDVFARQVTCSGIQEAAPPHAAEEYRDPCSVTVPCEPKTSRDVGEFASDLPSVVWDDRPVALEHREEAVVGRRMSSSVSPLVPPNQTKMPHLDPQAIAHIYRAMLQHEVQEVDDDISLSLLGKSMKMENRQSRAEVAPTRLNTEQALEHAVHRPHPRGDHSSEAAVPLPSISVSVTTRPTTTELPDNGCRSMSETHSLPSVGFGSSVETSERCPYLLESASTPELGHDVGSLEIMGKNRGSQGEAAASDCAQRTSTTMNKSTKTTRATTKRSDALRDDRRRIRERIHRLSSTSGSDLRLEGANVAVRSQAASDRHPSETAQRGPLTKQQKELVWKEFAATPLSEAMQNAYAELYPHMYPRVEDPNARVLAAEQPKASIGHVETASSFDHSSTTIPTQLTVEPAKSPTRLAPLALDKKFWSAVEGYHAIGSSQLIPLDEETVKARRREKAQAICTAFIDGHGQGDARLAHHELQWLAMYPAEVAAVRRRLQAAPRDLFDSLQQTAQLRITTAMASSPID